MTIQGVKKESDKKKIALSYWSKDKCLCPVCQKEFDREIMLSGQGRMIAGKLTDELHRIFEPSKRYGRIYPLIYDIGACPNCFTAMLWSDFKDIKNKDAIEKIYSHSEKRKQAVNTVFPYFDLHRQRSLFDGCAMYYLALLTYEDANVELLPTMKRAILSLRLAWLSGELNERCPGHNYDYMSKVLYQKATFFYEQAVVNEMNRVEKSSTLANCGPDMDKNYGWDGVIYLCGLLEYKYGQTDDQQLRLKKLSQSKTAIARIFGLGKSSKAKPGPLLEKSRDLYDKLSAEVRDDNI
ncbi:DUF2225 domain-containing protein [Treponema socranskii]|uniref:DUF2225 domain-containing protein n=1 Tax=Treponema socranskii TaxID=53419 RepID=UPI003D94F92D